MLRYTFQLQSHSRELSFSFEESGSREKYKVKWHQIFLLILLKKQKSFYNKEQKSAPLTNYPGEAALALGFSFAPKGTSCTLPRIIVVFSLKMS